MTDKICVNCAHWKPSFVDYGSCSLIGDSLEIEIDYGWDGGNIDDIHTEKGFGCNRFAEVFDHSCQKHVQVGAKRK